MMDFPFDLSSVRVTNCSTTNTGDWFIVVKVCVEPAPFIVQTDNKRIVYQILLNNVIQILDPEFISSSRLVALSNS